MNGDRSAHLTDPIATFRRTKRFIEAGEISMVAPELGALLLESDGTIRPGADSHLPAVRELIGAGDSMDRMIAAATDGARRLDDMMSVGGELIFEEMMLIVSTTSQSFGVQRLAELLGKTVPIAIMPDLAVVRRVVAKQHRLFKQTLSHARRNLFTPLPLGLI